MTINSTLARALRLARTEIKSMLRETGIKPADIGKEEISVAACNYLIQLLETLRSTYEGKEND